MSYYRRGYNWEQVQYLPAPLQGWNPDANPWEMAAQQAPILDNFWVRAGQIAARAGYAQLWTTNGTGLSPMLPLGCVASLDESAGFHGQAQQFPQLWVTRSLGQIGAAPGTADIPNNDAPLFRVSNAASLVTANNTLCGFRSTALGMAGTYTTSSSTVSQGLTPGWRYINFDGIIYAISADQPTGGGTVADTGSTYIMRRTQVLRAAFSPTGNWPGGGPGAFGPLAPLGSSAVVPSAPIDLIGYQERVWLLGGCDPQGAAAPVHSSIAVFCTNPGEAGIGSSAADWKDPVTGLTNRFLMDGDNSDFGVGLGVVRNAMLIFRHASVWALKGSTNANYTLVPVSREVGCIDQRSIVECDNGCYFMSAKGLMLTDGVTVKNVSGAALYTVREAAQATRALPGGYIFGALLQDGKILFTMGVPQVSGGVYTGANQSVWCGVFDPATGAWTRFTGSFAPDIVAPNASNSYPGPLYSNPDHGWTFSIGMQQVYQLEGQGMSITQDSDLATLCLIDYSVTAGQGNTIPALWQTRFVPIVGTTTLTRKFGQLKRAFVDYNYGIVSNAPVGNGMYIRLVDGANPPNTLPGAAGANPISGHVPLSAITTAGTQNSISLPNGVLRGVPAEYMQRQNVDCAGEISDMAFQIGLTPFTPTASLPSGAVANIHGVGVEYQPTRDLR